MLEFDECITILVHRTKPHYGKISLQTHFGTCQNNGVARMLEFSLTLARF